MDWNEARRRMVETQIATRHIRDPRVLQAMLEVPREEFVPQKQRELAYDDRPLDIGHDQTISQPYIVALMAEALSLGPGDRVLEIGAGSGYAAAVLSRIAAEVRAVEISPVLAAEAQERLLRLGYRNVHVRHGDGWQGWPERAPFQGISVAAAAPRVPPALVEQLADGGRLVIPVGIRNGQTLIFLRREGSTITETDLGLVRFVPLLGGTLEPAGRADPV